MAYAFQTGTIINDRYQLSEVVGQGGMSTVYLGFDPRLERQVAIKALHPFLTDQADFLIRFKQEASSIAKLRHQNIIQVFDYNEFGGIHYIALEYVEGGNLKQYLARLKRDEQYMPLSLLLPTMARLCDAVAYAHNHQMLHRDLKPENVMVRPDGEPVLTDFGIVKMLSGLNITTQTESLLGTAAYMSPEQIRSERLDHRSDLYSLGVVLYEMATGARPFVGNSPVQIMMKHSLDEVPPFSHFVDELRVAEINQLRPIIEKALQKEPNQRYKTALDFKAALDELFQTAMAAQPLENGAIKALALPTDPFVATGEATEESGSYLFKSEQFDSEILAQLSESAPIVLTPEQMATQAQQEIVQLRHDLGKDQLSESILRRLVLLLARSGDFVAALTEINQFQKRFTETVGIDLHPETISLRDSILAARLAPLHNLKRDNSLFVGRSHEVEAILALWHDPDLRILTLVGPGGIGKTRLAREVMRQLASALWRRFLHGIYWIPLDALDADGGTHALVYAVGQILGITFEGEAPPESQLFNGIQSREMLLVFDNFEHIVGQAPLIGRLLEAAPQVRVMVTSRHILELSQEKVFPVHGFRQQELDPAHADLTGPMLSDGPRLFLQICQKHNRRFQPTLAELESIERICDDLNGMPLGIELAAGWARAISVTEIERKIAENLDFLNSTGKNIPERHRSLRAVFEYSWKLLTAEEQTTLKNLSIFRSRFDIDAALDVGQTSLATISALIDKSLLQVVFMAEEGHTASQRAYTLQQMVRHFAFQKLREAPTPYQLVTERFHAYFIHYITARRSGVVDFPNLGIVSEIRFNYENIIFAWQSALLQPTYDADVAERLISASQLLTQYHLILGLYRQGVDLFVSAFATLPSAAPPELIATLQLGIASMQIYVSEFSAAEIGLSQAAYRIEDRAEQAYANLMFGELYHKIGQFDASREHGERALNQYKEIEDEPGVARATRFLGRHYYATGNFAQAFSYYEEAFALFQRLGDHFHAIPIRASQALPMVLVGQYDASKAAIMADLELATEWGHKPRMAVNLLNLAWTRTHVDELDQAEEEIGKSLVYYQECGDQEGECGALLVTARIYYLRREVALARSYFMQALNLANQISVLPKLYEAIGGLALTIISLESDFPEAYRLAQFVKRVIPVGSMGMFYVLEAENLCASHFTKEERAALAKAVNSLALDDVLAKLAKLRFNTL